VRVALLTNILTPYRKPVYQALAATPGWRLRVFTNAESEFDRPWRVEGGAVDVALVKGWSLPRRLRTRGPAAFEQLVTLHIPTGLLAALRRFAPDVVISAELGPRTLMALLYCALFRVPLVIWSYHSRASAGGAGPFQRALRRHLLAAARAVVGMGRQARAVLEELGVPRERIFDAPNAHDRDALARSLAGVDREARVAMLRGELGCRKRIALVAGRLIPMKGIANLLGAWNRVPEPARADWTLLFVGSGPLEAMVRGASRSRPPGEIVLTPAVKPSAMAGFYAAAELLVFPSLGDPWGLVVNEAFACGRPVVCSRLAGCADDMLEPGENGWTFDPTDEAEFAGVLHEALTTAHLERLGARARTAAERFRPEAMAEGIRRAALHARQESR
jgi:glycosyltransferase involved in cell wall biosynthesis